jgi:hypothetical protein
MRYPVTAGFVLLVLVTAACQPTPTITDDGRLIADNATTAVEAAVPTLFLPPTNTPVIVPTTQPTVPPSPTRAPAESDNVPIATARSDAIVVTPTLLPSKTPTVTPTQTIAATVTATATTTLTPQPSPTSEQFAFEGRQGSSTAAEATAYAEWLVASGGRATQQGTGGVSGQNAFVPPSNAQPAESSASQSPVTCSGVNWAFDVIPVTCPTAPADGTNAAFQRFQYGYMAWLEATDRIYVMYVNSGDPGWRTFTDDWVDGMDECSQGTAVNVASEQGWTPIRGFCLVWSRNADVKNRIGLSEDRYEYSYIARYQLGEDDSIAFEDNLGNFFYLTPGGKWQIGLR